MSVANPFGPAALLDVWGDGDGLDEFLCATAQKPSERPKGRLGATHRRSAWRC